MRKLLAHYEKIVVGIALAVFLAVATKSGSRLNEIEENAARNPVEGITPAPYEAETAQMPTIQTALWSEPQPRPRGEDWLYDVFTPPIIYYNRETGQFTVTPPQYAAPVIERDDGPFALELLEVRQEPYRIQLRGYIGDEGAYIATFELLDTGETVIGREGKVFERAQFTLKSFEVRQTATNARGSMPVVDSVAVAVIHDHRTDREVTLTNRSLKMLPRLHAVFRITTGAGEKRTVREGGSIVVDGQTYQVVQLSLKPPQAVVSRRSADSLGASETRVLLPVGMSGGDAFSDGNRRASRSIFSPAPR